MSPKSRGGTTGEEQPNASGTAGETMLMGVMMIMQVIWSLTNLLKDRGD